MSSGLLLIDKPAGLTSHDVVARARRLLHTKKVGHAGTLDPMATGLLVLGVGRATRLLTYIVGADKTYEATIRLGEATTTDDAEGEFLSTSGTADISDADIESALEAFRGRIDQVPSQVSAIKIQGKRAYARVRAGEDVELRARSVTIHEFTVQPGVPATGESGAHVLDVAATVRCSSGTYIRALARDLGKALGVGGHLTALRRTAVEPFSIAQASSLEDAALLNLHEVCSQLFPVHELNETERRDLSYGKPIGPVPHEGVVAAVWGDDVVGLVKNDEGAARALLVFQPAGAPDLE